MWSGAARGSTATNLARVVCQQTPRGPTVVRSDGHVPAFPRSSTRETSPSTSTCSPNAHPLAARMWWIGCGAAQPLQTEWQLRGPAHRESPPRGCPRWLVRAYRVGSSDIGPPADIRRACFKPRTVFPIYEHHESDFLDPPAKRSTSPHSLVVSALQRLQPGGGAAHVGVEVRRRTRFAYRRFYGRRGPVRLLDPLLRPRPLLDCGRARRIGGSWRSVPQPAPDRHCTRRYLLRTLLPRALRLVAPRHPDRACIRAVLPGTRTDRSARPDPVRRSRPAGDGFRR